MPSVAEQLLAAYPALRSVPDAEFRATAQRLPIIEVDAGAPLFVEGRPCQGFPCVLEGRVAVARVAPDGRGLELYRVGPGEVCLVSAACLFGSTPMTARAHAVEPTRVALVDHATMVRWTDARPWRLLLLGLMAERMSALAALVEEVAFQRLDQRLARLLAAQGESVLATHQQLAQELGTAREMVSRLLGRFEQQGYVRLGRERIDIVEPAALRRIADAL